MVESLAHLDGIAGGLTLAGIWSWWAELSGLIKGFYSAAFFFTALFAWQLIGALIGMVGSHDFDVDSGAADAGGDVDVGHGVDVGHDFHVDHPELDHAGAVHGAESVAAFKLLSIRSILAFFMLFTWAGALYMDQGVRVPLAMVYAMLWGSGSMLMVAGLFYLFRRLTETGSPRIATCLGTRGTVYLDIPRDGTGEVRVTVSGVLTHLKARGMGGQAMTAGTPIRVKRVLGPNTVEVMEARD
ncbi:MAG TPA: hypothetical protein VFJ30_15185 [Phycisphaerae bacterium]|nr:hypothetical protein [Phycisphaerae bacterium]